MTYQLESYKNVSKNLVPPHMMVRHRGELQNSKCNKVCELEKKNSPETRTILTLFMYCSWVVTCLFLGSVNLHRITSYRVFKIFFFFMCGERYRMGGGKDLYLFGGCKILKFWKDKNDIYTQYNLLASLKKNKKKLRHLNIL